MIGCVGVRSKEYNQSQKIVNNIGYKLDFYFTLLATVFSVSSKEDLAKRLITVSATGSLAVLDALIAIIRFRYENTDILNTECCLDLIGSDGIGNPLTVAIMKGNVEVVKLLIGGGADLKQVRDPLLIAVSLMKDHQQRFAMIEYLLSQGAKVTFDKNVSSFHRAAEYKYIDTMWQLLPHVSKELLLQVDSQGITALGYIYTLGQDKLILQAIAKDPKELAPIILSLAIEERRETLIDGMLETVIGDFNLNEYRSKAICSSLAILANMVEKGMKIDLTHLIMALQHQRTDHFFYLLQYLNKTGQINTKQYIVDENKMTLLHAAAYSEYFEEILDQFKELKIPMPPVDVQSISGDTPLMIAVMCKNGKAIKYFLDNKAHVNKGNLSGVLPIDLAENDLALTTLLLSYGAYAREGMGVSTLIKYFDAFVSN